VCCAAQFFYMGSLDSGETASLCIKGLGQLQKIWLISRKGFSGGGGGGGGRWRVSKMDSD